MQLVPILKTEFKNNIIWHTGWIVTLIFMLILVIVIYPGDQAMRDFMPLLQIDLFEAFIGSIGGASPNYTLWIAILIPMMTIGYFLYGLTTGVRVVTQSISDHTGELIHTLPVTRSNFLLSRMIVNYIPFSLFFLFQFILLFFNITGYSIEFEKLLTITWWGMLYLLGAMLIGMILGLIAGNTGRGFQLSFLLVLVLYAIQILGRLQANYVDINNFNPLNFYQPEIVLLTNTMKEGLVFGYNYPIYPVYIAIMVIICWILAFFEYNRKDLDENAGFHLNFFNKFNKENKPIIFLISIWSGFKGIVFPKRVKNNPFVFWARIFERKLPITADFIYSDNMTLFITFLAWITIFPFQLGLYPGDKLISESIIGFTGNPFFLLITYGVNLGSEAYLWFLISQGLGVFWMVLMPVCFYWASKVIIKDGNSATGEILGSLPIQARSVVFQRLLATFLELIYLILWIIVFVIISEYITGSSYNLQWEIITLVCSIPFYEFLLLSMIEINLLFKNKGRIISGLFLFGIVISFFVSILNDSFNTWYIRGLFSLYNPVLILQEKSIFVANYGVIILSICCIAITIILINLATRFNWLVIETRKQPKY